MLKKLKRRTRRGPKGIPADCYINLDAVENHLDKAILDLKNSLDRYSKENRELYPSLFNPNFNHIILNLDEKSRFDDYDKMKKQLHDVIKYSNLYYTCWDQGEK